MTIGHLLEWSRLALSSAPRSGTRPRTGCWPTRRLFGRALELGWAVDGEDGFVYTVDFDGRPVVR